MHNITFDLSGMHRFGTAFYDYLRLRKAFFVDTLHWDIPHDDAVEMDQYDNPLAQYSLVLRDGLVIGGARAMPTTAIWGQHTYMLRDAVAGKLPDIPQTILSNAISAPEVWECTRLVIADCVDNHADRARVLSMLLEGVTDVAVRHGACELVSLSPVLMVRTLRQLGWPAARVGEPYDSKEDGRRYAVLSMPMGRGRAAAHSLAAQ